MSTPTTHEDEFDEDRFEEQWEIGEGLWSLANTFSDSLWDEHPDRHGLPPAKAAILERIRLTANSISPTQYGEALELAMSHGEEMIRRMEQELAQARRALRALSEATPQRMRALLSVVPGGKT